MPPAKKSFLRDNVALVASMIPVVAVIIAGFGYVFTMANNVSDSKEKIGKIESQLEKAGRVLEVNSFGESTLELEINGLSYYVHEDIDDRLLDLEERLTLLEIALSDLQESYDSTLFYLYSMDSQSGGVQQSIQSIKTHLSVIENQIAGIMSDHNWYSQYLSSLEDTLRDDLGVNLSIVMPKDSYDYGSSYGR